LTCSIESAGWRANSQFLQTLDNTDHVYQSIEGDFAIKLLLQNLVKQTSASFDTPKLRN
jgi:DNA polymerase-1